MRSLKLLTVFALIGFVSAFDFTELLKRGPPAPQTNCNSAAFGAAKTHLMKALNLQGIFDKGSAKTFHSNLITKYSRIQSITDFTNICNAFNVFYGYLGAANIRFCLGPLGLIKQGHAPEEAFYYDGILRLNRFQCGAGYYMAQYRQGDMLKCFVNTWTNSKKQMLAATANYASNVKDHDNDQINACKYAGALQSKYAQIFRIGMCSRYDPGMAAYFGCEGQSQFIRAQFPHCVYENRCNYNEILKGPQYAKLNENGEVLIRNSKFVTKGNVTVEEFGEWF